MLHDIILYGKVIYIYITLSHGLSRFLLGEEHDSRQQMNSSVDDGKK